jgi:hypothetical protein
VQLLNSVPQCRKSGVRRLYEHEDFYGFLNLSLPAIDALNGWQYIHTGRQSAVDQRFRDSPRLLFVGAGAEYDHCVRHKKLFSLDLSLKQVYKDM